MNQKDPHGGRRGSVSAPAADPPPFTPSRAASPGRAVDAGTPLSEEWFAALIEDTIDTVVAVDLDAGSGSGTAPPSSSTATRARKLAARR
jgi:hypothetical protein